MDVMEDNLEKIDTRERCNGCLKDHRPYNESLT